MKVALKPEEIKSGWVTATATLGKFIALEKGRSLNQNGFNIQIIPCRFEKGTLNVIVSFDQSDKVAGLLLKMKTERRTSSPNETAARAVITSFTKGDFVKATANFDATMKAKLTAKQLEDTWKQLITASGAFEKQEGMISEVAGGYDVITITCKFGSARYDYRITFDRDHKIAGLFIVPTPTK